MAVLEELSKGRARCTCRWNAITVAISEALTQGHWMQKGWVEMMTKILGKAVDASWQRSWAGQAG